MFSQNVTLSKFITTYQYSVHVVYLDLTHRLFVDWGCGNHSFSGFPVLGKPILSQTIIQVFNYQYQVKCLLACLLKPCQWANWRNQCLSVISWTAPHVVVVANQPLQGPLPDDYCTYSILNTIFCCFWIGIFAIIKSQNVRDAIARGRYW